MEENLTENNANKQKVKGLLKKKTQKKTNKTNFCNISSSKIYIFIIIICAILILFFAYLIFVNLRKVSELDSILVERNKELEAGEKTRLEMLSQIEDIEKRIELKKKYIEEKGAIDAEKLEEYNAQKKIYENLESVENKIIDESNMSILLDESIANLKKRISALKSEKKL